MPSPDREDFRRSRNYYLALASEWAAPIFAAAGAIATGATTPPTSWRKGLIISHTHIGDVLYRTPSLAHLVASLPDCRWDYLVSPASAPVLTGNSAISRALPLVRGENSWSLSDGGFADLRGEGYDVALCTNSLRHYPDLALAVALGIPNRAGYSDRGFSGLITRPVTLDRPQPFPSYFREMVKQVCALDEDWLLEPEVTVTSEHRSMAAAFLGDFADDSTALLACCPTSRQPAGSWPEQFFIDVVNAVAGEIPVRVLLCGTADERARLERSAAELAASNRVMAGELDLISFAALLSRCDLAFTQDSAARHLGNAVRTPVVFLRNLAVNAVESGSYCSGEEDVAPSEGLVAPAAMANVRGRVSAGSVASRIVARIRDAQGR